MKRKGKKVRLWQLALLLSILAISHHFVFRPWFLHWGATSQIQTLALPGDVFTGDRGPSRAVLINAAPEEIWPWIIQLGQERGGMYSYDWLENLVQADIHNVYEIRADLQLPRHVGDTVWLANRTKYNGKGYQIVALVEPLRALVMVDGSQYARIMNGGKAGGSWSIYLYPADNRSTWLIARSAAGGYSTAEKVVRYVVFELPHFIMEQKMLRTIKRLAEESSCCL